MTDNWTSRDEYLANYTADATWEIDGVDAYVGHGGIGQRIEEMLERRVCGPGLPARHSLTSLEVIPDPDDARAALARSFGVMVSTVDGSIAVVRYGEKHDHVREEDDGVWRVRRRITGGVSAERGERVAAGSGECS